MSGPQDLQGALDLDAGRLDALPRGDGPDGPRLVGVRVLVVEDDLLVALDLAEALGRAGAEVVGPVACVADAALLLAVGRIDAAVLDVHLGEETSYPLADVLIAADVPIVFATGHAREEAPERFHQVGWCEKPLAMTELVQALGAVIGGQHPCHTPISAAQTTL